MGKSQTQETKRTPLPEVYDMLRSQAWPGAQQAYQTPKEFFPESTVAPRSRFTMDAQDAVSGLGQDQFRTEGQDFLGSVLGGDFMQPRGSNPYLDERWKAMSDRISESYKRITAPTTASRFGQAGRSSSDAMNLAIGQNERNLGETLGRTSADIYYGDYENRMRDRMAALTQVPQMQQLGYQDIAQQRQAGLVDEDYFQRQLNESIQRFNFGQTEQDLRLDQLFGRLGQTSNFGITSQTMPDTTGLSIGLGAMGLLGSLGGAALMGPLAGGLGGLVGGGVTGGGGGAPMGYTELMGLYG